jgi:predicted enzyme related to lactoylglutathione lyase
VLPALIGLAFANRDKEEARPAEIEVLGVEGGDLRPDLPAARSRAVDDIEFAVAAVEARGIPIVMKVETPVCFPAMINDTEGNTVTLHKRKVR